MTCRFHVFWWYTEEAAAYVRSIPLTHPAHYQIYKNNILNHVNDRFIYIKKGFLFAQNHSSIQKNEYIYSNFNLMKTLIQVSSLLFVFFISSCDFKEDYELPSWDMEASQITHPLKAL